MNPIVAPAPDVLLKHVEPKAGGTHALPPTNPEDKVSKKIGPALALTARKKEPRPMIKAALGARHLSFIVAYPSGFA